MNCAEANQIVLIDCSRFLGHETQKIAGNNYWYFSPFRDEKTTSFKVEKNKNLWYDHELGKVGKPVDFVMEFYQLNVSEALQKISLFHPQNKVTNTVNRPWFHLHENSLIDPEDATETGIRIIAAKQPIGDLMLCRNAKQRNIPKSIIDSWYHEVHFNVANREKIYRAIGFKNNAGGYEFALNSLKEVPAQRTFLQLKTSMKKIIVFEGFFDFLSFISSITKNQIIKTNFCILNSLSFFEKSRTFLEQHNSIHLSLHNDTAGIKTVSYAKSLNEKYIDESSFYKNYKDLNDRVVNIGKGIRKPSLGIHR